MQIDYCYLDVECIIFLKKGKKLNFPIQLCRQITSPHQLLECIFLLSHPFAIADLPCSPTVRTPPPPNTCWIQLATHDCDTELQVQNAVGLNISRVKKERKPGGFSRERPVSFLCADFQPVLAWGNAARWRGQKITHLTQAFCDAWAKNSTVPWCYTGIYN